jgi:phosphatidate cytidylyltransferase
VPQAVFVGIAIAAVAIILFKIGPAAAMILVEAVVVLAAIEFFSAVRRGGHRPATLLGLAAVAAFPLAVYWRGEGAIPVVLFLTVVFTMLWYLLGVGGPARAVPNIGVTLFGVLYIGLLGAFAALILDIPVQGVSILLVAAFAGVGYDVGGFFIGQRMGKTPLTDISPGKTVEGLAGGMIASLVAVLIVSRFFGPFDSFGKALVFGVCLAIAAPFGDLCESLLKRDLGLKDMGSILPGHGGVLDRFDGMLFVLPAAYYLVRVLGLVPGF